MNVTSPCEPVSPRQERINARYRFRRDLFIRRGQSHEVAGLLGYQLENRDADKDDRRMCLECTHLQRANRCWQVQQGNMRGVSAKHEPVTTILSRCDYFQFQTP